MPFPLIPLLIGLGGGIGNFLGSRKGARTGQIDQTSTRDFTDTTDINILDEIMPLLTDSQGRLQESLISEVLNQLFRPETTTDSLITQGIFNINRGADANKQALSRSLAARGLSRSPAASSAIANAEGSRISDITQLRNQAPILADQLRQQNLSLAGQVFGSLPKGQTSRRTGTTTSTSTGTQRTQGTNIQPGSALGSGIGGFAQLLAYLYARNPNIFGGGQGGTGPGSGFASVIPKY